MEMVQRNFWWVRNKNSWCHFISRGISLSTISIKWQECRLINNATYDSYNPKDYCHKPRFWNESMLMPHSRSDRRIKKQGTNPRKFYFGISLLTHQAPTEQGIIIFTHGVHTSVRKTKIRLLRQNQGWLKQTYATWGPDGSLNSTDLLEFYWSTKPT